MRIRTIAGLAVAGAAAAAVVVGGAAYASDGTGAEPTVRIVQEYGATEADASDCPWESGGGSEGQQPEAGL